MQVSERTSDVLSRDRREKAVIAVNISDSMQGRSAGYVPQPSTQANVRPDSSSKSQENVSKSDKLEALKTKMQSGQPVNLNELADTMLHKGTIFDVQA